MLLIITVINLYVMSGVGTPIKLDFGPLNQFVCLFVCLLFVVECCYYSYGGINDSHIHF